MKSLGYIFKVDFCVNIDEGFCLFWLNVFFNIVLETLSKLGDIVPSKGKACSVSVSAEVQSQVATAFNSCINIKAHDRPCRPRCEVAITCKYNGWAEIYFG